MSHAEISFLMQVSSSVFDEGRDLIEAYHDLVSFRTVQSLTLEVSFFAIPWFT
jgi:hypothetical protein